MTKTIWIVVSDAMAYYWYC